MADSSIIVKAPARLHLGLVKSSEDGLFMSAGVSLSAPWLEVSVRLASAEKRAPTGKVERGASSILARIGCNEMAHAETITPLPVHHGFGSGTRMALSVCAGALKLAGEKMDVLQMAKLMGRGRRSAMGAVLFDQGGVAADMEGEILRVSAPSGWRVVLVSPKIEGDWRGIHGRLEKARIDSVAPCPAKTRNRLARAAVEGLMAGSAADDFDAFQRGVAAFQSQAVAQFGLMQGGGASTENGRAVLRRLKKEGIKACGQSSWGPVLFAIMPTADEAKTLAQEMKKLSAVAEVKIVEIENRGRRLRKMD